MYIKLDCIIRNSSPQIAYYDDVRNVHTGNVLQNLYSKGITLQARGETFKHTPTDTPTQRTAGRMMVDMGHFLRSLRISERPKAEPREIGKANKLCVFISKVNEINI